ncbi:RNHCP domain-containing protein [Kyrpidia spormannii]|uniref:RNHCP domain-containing protein n=2 Tax=Kyrpidia spormannii TaxID=2055160 RepID=A0A2K8N9Q4_9BACL|nr:RNHCP domain-containing protein [Kyrpidia spormannii]ATY85162.1 RNHCP domain-containing protein [Kyrpidia spormannii]CAB3392830.1 RNHCP domain-containing protein [Kyrpidia spormannii]CAB3393742.1 RNHCP domain-containing protein [Kyrpidia spormannii]HHY65960.1 RNHCP domain-containing protein [Alicyclobacillus sp.]
MAKRFTVRNESFVCVHCGLAVAPLPGSCRNHCPRCLWSLHVDELPGDRAAACGGPMEPVAVEYDGKKGYRVVHRCLSCGHISRNKLFFEARVQPDSLEAALALLQGKV